LNSIGRITEIWRYPISSLGGERIASTIVTDAGIVGDRQFALVDDATGVPAAPEKHARWRKALHLQARCVAGELPTITFPDGPCCAVNDRALNALLSDYFEFAVAIAANGPIDGHPDFRRTEHRHMHFPIHVLTTASLQHVAELRQVEAVDVRRFRPTVLIETGDIRGFAEKQWIGQSLHLGAVALRAVEETTRCGMTFIPQPGIEDDPEILRTILRNNRRHLGLNCSVESIGTLQEGDDVSVGTSDYALASAGAASR
jgi:uncharacterized protein YcbX